MPRPGQAVASAILNDKERNSLARAHRDMAGFSSAIVVVSRGDVEEDVVAAVRQVVNTFNSRQHADVEEVVGQLLAKASQRPELVANAERQVRFRTKVLRDFGAYTSAEIADLVGSRSARRAGLATRWEASGRIFSVPFDGQTLYIKFQFDRRGRPLDVVKAILPHFHGWDPWEKASWFVTPNGLLHQRRPAVVLLEAEEDEAKEELVTAARLDARLRPPRS
jgi:hypothetical protein